MTNPFSLGAIQRSEAETPDPANDNPFALRNVQADRGAQLRNTLNGAVQSNPDAASDAARLGKRYQIAPDVALRNVEELRQREQADNARATLADAPALTETLIQRPFVAKQAHADISTLAGVESMLRSFLDPVDPKPAPPKAGVLTNAMFRARIDKVMAANPALDVDTARALALQGSTLDNISTGFLEPERPKTTLANLIKGIFTNAREAGVQADQGAERFIADVIGAEATAERAAAQSKASRDRQFVGVPEPESRTGRNVYGGINSLVQQTPGLAASIITGTPAPALASIFGTTYGPNYNKYRDRGATIGEATMGSTLESGLEVATEFLPMKIITDKIGKVGIKGFMQQYLGAELWTEEVNTVLSGAVDTAIANPDKTWGQYFAELPGDMLDTAVQTLVQSGILAGASRVLQSTVMAGQAQEYRNMETIAQAERLTDMLKAATEVGLREKSPEEFRAVMQSMVEQTEGAPQQVFVDAEVLAQLPGEVLAQLPGMAEQMQEALASGDVVALNMADVLTVAPGTALEQTLAEHGRIGDPFAMSQFEAKAAGEQAQVYLQQKAAEVIQQASDQQAMQESSDRVRQGILDQLSTTKRFRKEVNEGYATWTAAFYTTMAGRLGITPEEMAAKYPLRIVDKTGAGGVLNTQADRTQSVTLAGRDVPVTLSRQDAQAGYSLTNVDTALFDAGFKAADDQFRQFYVGAQGEGGIAGRYERFAEFSATAKSVEAPTVSVDANGKVSFGNGRHRFAFMRDQGVGQIPVAMDAESLANATRFGYTTRGNTRTDQTQTPEFQNWFGDSKVVDGAGMPIKMFHATDAEFTAFNTPSYFTEDSEDASGYGGRVEEVFVSIRNPYWADDTEQDAENRSELTGISEEYAVELARQGYDGVMGYRNGQTLWAIPFNPTQIKSAIGNNGAFDPYDADILNQSVTTMVPTNKGAVVNPSTVVVPGLDAADQPDAKSQAAMEANVNTFNNKVQVIADKPKRGYESIKVEGNTLREKAESIINQMVRNLHTIYDAIRPEVRERSKLWYDGANRISLAMAERYGLTPMQAAGQLAVTSPQADWYMNVSYVERINDILKYRIDHTWDAEMEAWAEGWITSKTQVDGRAAEAARRAQGVRDAVAAERAAQRAIVKAQADLVKKSPGLEAKITATQVALDEAETALKAAKKAKDDRALKKATELVAKRNEAAKEARAALRTAKGAVGKAETAARNAGKVIEEKRAYAAQPDENLAVQSLIRGKKLSELNTDFERAWWIRAYDEAHNPRDYRIVTPEGGFLSFAKLDDGVTNDSIGWKSFSAIAKAVSIARDGSLENVHAQLGGEHKVRNFYNNIFDPNSDHPFVTSDTHQVAANLFLPLGADALEVGQNFGGTGSKSVGATGLNGTYWLFHEAVKKAAEAKDILPREMQSISWEAIRNLFSPSFKASSDSVNAVRDLWLQYQAGGATYEDTIKSIVTLAGGSFRDPFWVGTRPDSAAAIEDGATSYESGLAQPRSRQQRRDVPGRGNQGDAGPDVSAGGVDGVFQQSSGRSEQAGNRGGRYSSGGLAPLAGAPSHAGATGPIADVVATAERYAAANGINLRRQAEYVQVDPDLSRRIAEAYTAMEHTPDDPRVQASYDALIRETRAQYDALVEAGYTFTFFDSANDPYKGNPWPALRDLRDNKTMAVYGTYDGYGNEVTGFETTKNLLVVPTGLQWPDQAGVMRDVTANDLFRAVHDAFGHGMEGAGFRAQGEANAFEAHARLFSPAAMMALTTETRAQNSWLNYGPYAEQNQTASVTETVFADQKNGILPEWTWTEGRAADNIPPGGTEDGNRYFSQTQRAGPGAANVNDGVDGRSSNPHAVDITGVHFSTGQRTSLDGRYFGTGLKGLEQTRLRESTDSRIRERVYFYIDEGAGVRPEAGVGGYAHEVPLTNLYNTQGDPLKLFRAGDLNGSESRVLDAGYDGYYFPAYANQQGIAIVMGAASRGMAATPIASPARAAPDLAPPKPYTRGLMSREINALDMAPVVAAAPSARLRSGTFQVDQAEFAAAQAAMREQGIDLPDVFNQPARGTFNPKSLELALNENADLSTFFHETGHFFLEVMADLANRPDAPVEVREDMDTILKWFGVPDLATWQAYDLEGKRPYHERFAESIEQYVLEGKAPSVELQPAFRRFKSWLLSVYQNIKRFIDTRTGATQIQLSDEVRQVFDRMLASEEQIAQAEEVAGLLPDENATPDAVEKLTARSIRDLKWAVGARSKMIKAMQAQAAKLRKEVEAEVRAEVDEMPVYQAMDARERALEKFAEDPFAVDAGLDSIATQYGYTSLDHMMREIENAEPKADMIQGLADQRMLERHGDLIDQRAIEEAANAAVHNDARAKALATELSAQAEMLNPREETGKTTKKGAKITVNAITQAAKIFAANIVARTTVRDLQAKARQHLAAEARAGKRWLDATKKADTQAAVKAKQDQVLNNAAAKAAMEAKDDVAKMVDYLKKFDKESIRKNLPVDYLDQIDKLLEAIDLRVSTSGAAIDKRASLRKWVESQQALGLDPILPENLLEDMVLTSYKEMTVEQITDLVDIVKNIEHLGRLKSKLLAAKDKREFDIIAAEIAAEIIANGGKPRPVQLEPDGRIKKFFKGAWADHRKLNSLVHQMDGGKDNGPFYRALVRSMNDAGADENVRLEKATEALAKIYAPIEKLPGGISGAKLYIPEIKNSLTRAGRLSVALNWGNAQNRQRVLSGDNWTEAQVNAILKTLTPVELEFVNNVWEHIDSYWPDVKAKQLRVSGVVEDKVEAEPFEIEVGTGAERRMVKMRGGYYPIKYDGDRSIRAERNEAKERAAEIMRGAVARPTTRRGHTKARVDEVQGRPVKKDLSVITQHVNQVVHDLAWHEWFIDANRILNDPRILGAIRDHHGPDIHRAMTDAIEAIAVGDAVHQGQIDKLLLLMRANVTRSIMGASLTTALLQPFGLTQSMARIGVVPVLKGAGRWAGDAVRMESTVAWINEKSDFMRLRSKTFNRELREISQRVQGKSKFMQVADASLFFLMQKLQMVADVPTWVGAYEKALAGGVDESAAVALADEAVLSSQGGGTTKDLAAVQRNMPFLTQFYSYFNTTLNLVAEKTALTDFKNPRAAAGWLGDMALLAVVPAILPALITYLLKGGDEDDPEKLAKKMLEWQASYLLGMFVGLRELPTLWSPFDYGGPPAAKLLNDGKRLVQQAGQGEIDDPAVLATIGFLGTALGIPTTQIIRSYKGWLAWDEGDAPATSILFGPPPRD